MVLDVRIGSVSCNEEAAWSSSDGSNKGFSSEWTCTETLLRDLELVVTGGNAVVADIMGAQTAGDHFERPFMLVYVYACATDRY